MADFGVDTELEAFRGEARTWLEENAPPVGAPTWPELTMEQMEGGVRPTADADLAQADHGRRRVGSVPHLAEEEYGGGGAQQRPGARAAAGDGAHRASRNPIQGMRGPGMFGATLLEYGTEAQKLCAICPLSAAASCAGARATPSRTPAPTSPACRPSSKTRATTGRSTARRSGPPAPSTPTGASALVPTPTPSAKKHEGISFVLINMRQPGKVEARLRSEMISGASGQCETFFTGARVEKDDMVGPLNGGWTIGKRLLQHERSGQGGGRLMGGGAVSIARRGQEVCWNRRQRPAFADSDACRCAPRRQRT